jgi:hypothetical protein
MICGCPKPAQRGHHARRIFGIWTDPHVQVTGCARNTVNAERVGPDYEERHVGGDELS